MVEGRFFFVKKMKVRWKNGERRYSSITKVKETRRTKGKTKLHFRLSIFSVCIVYVYKTDNPIYKGFQLYVNYVLVFYQ